MTSRGRTLLALSLIAVALLVAVYSLSRPRNVAAIVTHRAGAALGLEITAGGASEYRLRGTPMLVLRDVVVREPGAAVPLLTAQRIHVALPWSTLRSGGGDLVARRVELDRPRLDLPALQHWLATRPPAAGKRLPTLTDGLAVADGEITAAGWRIDRIHADMPLLSAGQPLRARLRGRYLARPLSIPVDLAVAIVAPEALLAARRTGFAVHGAITLVHDGSAPGEGWQLPATVTLSGPLQFDADALRIAPARFGTAATFEKGSARVAFALGLHGPLHFAEATWTLAPAGVALRRRGDADTEPVPTLDAHGRVALGRKLTLRLDGEIAQWPPAWPALPPPIGQSRSPLPFALRYDGAPAMADVASLDLRRDASRLEAHFRLPQVLDWVARNAGSPLPPLAGRLRTPALEVSGAKLEGIEVEFDDPEIPGTGVPP